MKNHPSQPELAAEVEALRTRLAETEALLHAIRFCEVDGLVVETTEGPQVFTRQGAQEPYRLLIEQMPEGALMLSPKGVILYSNPSFARLVQTPLERVIGAEFRAFVDAAEQPVIDGWVEAARRGRSQGDVSVRATDGSFVPLRLGLRLGLSRLSLASETLVGVVATDFTEVREHEAALRQANGDMERRVAERTADLAASRLAALNMMEEAIESRKILASVNRELLGEITERKRVDAHLRKLSVAGGAEPGERDDHGPARRHRIRQSRVPPLNELYR
ncbi:MAG: PAS domain-containing protein [Limisphaerales bacterium]